MGDCATLQKGDLPRLGGTIQGHGPKVAFSSSRAVKQQRAVARNLDPHWLPGASQYRYSRRSIRCGIPAESCPPYFIIPVFYGTDQPLAIRGDAARIENAARVQCKSAFGTAVNRHHPQ